MKKIIVFFTILFLSSFPLISLAVVSNTKNSNKTKANTGVMWIDDLVKGVPTPSLETVLRAGRVLSAIFAILFINTLLIGAFNYMISSGRDDEVSKSRRFIAIGLIGAVCMFFLFFLFSANLLKIV